MSGPQTTREALMAELLGDAGALLDRVEALQVAIPGVTDTAVSQVYLAGEEAAKSIMAAAEEFGALLARERDLIAKPISEATASIRASADVVEGGARRLTTTALLVGLAGGALAGLIGGIAGAAFFMS
ncbi:hypothetical protein P2W50_31425 [Pseudomonas protegens]|uniref:hypothetical protein n=1 Tax=Pseudomonas protegens TaxID=380021 RepID=UPI0023EDEC41|nr:hypothetical protein [Pseudomonas protegens]MDF4211165.1 hypothetical protein [Pseudomonas protegens]